MGVSSFVLDFSCLLHFWILCYKALIHRRKLNLLEAE